MLRAYERKASEPALGTRKDFLEDVPFQMDFKAAVPNLFGTRDQFRGRQFFHWGGGDGFRMIQAHCIYCAPYF